MPEDEGLEDSLVSLYKGITGVYSAYLSLLGKTPSKREIEGIREELLEAQGNLELYLEDKT